MAKSAGQPGKQWSLRALPSFAGEGAAFDLTLEGPLEIPDDALPQNFKRVEHTRRLTSTTLRSDIFEGKATFWVFSARTRAVLSNYHLRSPKNDRLPTLYDLELRIANQGVHRVPHALCLRPQAGPAEPVRFVHLTDLHLAERNDLWADQEASIVPPPAKPGWLIWFLKASIWFVKFWNIFAWVFRRLVWGNQRPHQPKGFVNFNQHMRLFIKWANTEADNGKLDFILATGDLVDFVEQGITRPPAAPNNWRVLVEIITGTGKERNPETQESGQPRNVGLKVPVFTSTGNHDWRANPYPPELDPKLFGLRSARDDQLDYVYRDSSEALGKRLEQVYADLLKNGSPILALSWWHSIVSFGVRGVPVLMGRIWTRLVAWANKALRSALASFLATLLLGVLSFSPLTKSARFAKLAQYLQLSPPPLSSATQPTTAEAASLAVAMIAFALCLLWVLKAFLEEWGGGKLRRIVEGVIAIEESLPGLRDYFLEVNPYFNYAFSFENCYFLVLDTGHDCLTGQSFWDQGGKKLGRLSLKNNFLGSSPDSMGFYPPNTYFPYGQIAWLERILDCIRENRKGPGGSGPGPGGERPYRVFVGLHSPPANLSEWQCKRAEHKLAKAKPKAVKVDARTADDYQGILLKKRWLFGWDVRYGTVNHYLSQFYYLCLGSREDDPKDIWGCGVDVVLAGHAHWCMEFSLEHPHPLPANWKPLVSYGRFAEAVKGRRCSVGPYVAPGSPVRECEEKLEARRHFRSLLLQTAACGPPCWPKGTSVFAKPPYCRRISVEKDGRLSSLEHLSLGVDCEETAHTVSVG